MEDMQTTFNKYAPVTIKNKVTFKRAIGPIETEWSIPTLEGTMTASIGDYIIEGLNGEYYPCKPDIFKKSYDLV